MNNFRIGPSGELIFPGNREKERVEILEEKVSGLTQKCKDLLSRIEKLERGQHVK